MLRALVQAAERFRREGKLPPTGYKPKTPKWVINLEVGKAYLEGPYTKKEIRDVYAPDRQRSGKKPEAFLLLDKAQYVFGVPKGDDVSKELHAKYVELLESAASETKEPCLERILDFVRNPQLEGLDRIDPEDLVAIRVEPNRYPFELESVQQFWSDYLKRELLIGHEAACSVCNNEGKILRILPREIVILGQKCQITSFNKPAFLSFGRDQTANSPICFDCAIRVIDALAYLIRDEQHHRALVNDPKASGLENQLAVFWLDKKVEVPLEGRTYDLEVLLGAVLDNARGQGELPAELSQLETLLAVPWTAREAALNLDERRFYLVVLSANKGRLVVRDWFEACLERLRKNLRIFFDRQRVVSPKGENPRAFPIPALLKALKAGSPYLTQDLLRTAYLGLEPRTELLGAALRRFRNPKVLRDPKMLHPLVALLKLVLTYGGEEAKNMERLDPGRNERAYLCGRLLAVLEEAQQRASGWSLNSTLADRFYAATAAAPAASLATLFSRAKVSHLPKIRREGRGCREIERLLEEILSRLDAQEGFPPTLDLKGQAEFALGYYHQRAEFRGKNSTTQSVGGAR